MTMTRRTLGFSPTSRRTELVGSSSAASMLPLRGIAAPPGLRPVMAGPSHESRGGAGPAVPGTSRGAQAGRGLVLMAVDREVVPGLHRRQHPRFEPVDADLD